MNRHSFTQTLTHLRTRRNSVRGGRITDIRSVSAGSLLASVARNSERASVVAVARRRPTEGGRRLRQRRSQSTSGAMSDLARSAARYRRRRHRQIFVTQTSTQRRQRRSRPTEPRRSDSYLLSRRRRPRRRRRRGLSLRDGADLSPLPLRRSTEWTDSLNLCDVACRRPLRGVASARPLGRLRCGR